MNEIIQEEKIEKENKFKWAKRILPIAKKLLSKIAWVGIASAVLTLIITIKINFFSQGEIKCSSFAKYKLGEIAVYQGELINPSSYHADKVTIKGKFNSEIIRLDIDTSDSFEAPKINNTMGSLEFKLERLARGNKCLFSIVVSYQSEIIEQLHISWVKNGDLKLSLQEADPKIQKAFDLGKDFSRRARQKWFENNAKNIR